MENMNLAAILLTSLLSGLEQADAKGQEDSTRPEPIETRQVQADQRPAPRPGPLVEAQAIVPAVAPTAATVR